ncbi:unnamed protein product [Neospora caninum Liverpool]|uniref:Rhoptry protein ROP13 n=1 Tax=Neospora caninum (strain Liverpool) TaxID=572307 RepID=F0VN64_NEOCL|nr:uncharacterized protein NCLIV_055850 [Neospora caninum Liverpool]CBZ55160.1 unnamed protein product [Neospora caninum Liverpool]CEL69886.1 TPA: rhoptry protein ROP13 [Neospora caninum Liverpool]|eukprot:XP_003885188.1 uncharacterized protein NCLIV_055850 [Neospora caninum Liverpool]
MKRPALCFAALVAAGAIVSTPNVAAKNLARSLGHLDASKLFAAMLSPDGESRNASLPHSLSFAEGGAAAPADRPRDAGVTDLASQLRVLKKRSDERRKDNERRQKEWDEEKAKRAATRRQIGGEESAQVDPMRRQRDRLDACLRQASQEPPNIEDLCKGVEIPDDCRSVAQHILSRQDFSKLHVTSMNFHIYFNRAPLAFLFPVLDATDLRLLVKLYMYITKFEGCDGFSVADYIQLVAMDVFSSEEYLAKANHAADVFGEKDAQLVPKPGWKVAAVTRWMKAKPDIKFFEQPFLFVTAAVAAMLEVTLRHPFLTQLVDMACVVRPLCRKGLREVLLWSLEQNSMSVQDVPLDSAPRPLVDQLRVYLRTLLVGKYKRVRSNGGRVAAQFVYAYGLKLSEEASGTKL